MEDSHYNPGAWQGHDFKSAQQAYQAKGARSYAQAQAAGVTARDAVAPQVSSDSTCPVVIMVDVTGSMGSWPSVVFGKLPYLDIEGKEYFPDLEISFAAIGDRGDSYPVQVRPFAKGRGLEEQLGKLIIEAQGRGNGYEAYEMGALYYTQKCSTPNAVNKPIFIFVADEEPFPVTSRGDAAGCGLDLAVEGSRSAKNIFDDLKAKFSVYLVYKQYVRGGRSSRPTWVDLVGEDRIVDLDDPERVVDVIFGIFAKETSRVDYFRKELEGRQTEKQVKVVYEALKTVHHIAHRPSRPGMSRMHVPTDAKKGGDLL